MRITLLVLFILSLLSFAYPQDNDLGGIKFHSQEVQRYQRTSLFLNENKPIELTGSFSISFDISFWDPKRFGPVLRIDDKQASEIRIVYDQHSNDDTSHIHIIQPFYKKQIDIKISKKEIVKNRWFNFKLIVDRKTQSLKAYWDSVFIGELNYPVDKQKEFSFAFGIKDRNNYSDYDVPAICIKNILIEENNIAKYFWELNPLKENPLLDKISGSRITAVNPLWVYSDHQNWKEEKSFNISDSLTAALGIAYDLHNSRFFIDKKNELLIYDLISGKESIVKYKTQSPAFWNGLKYDNSNQMLYSYMTGMGKVSVYDINKNDWIYKDTSKDFSGHYFGSAKFTYPKENDIYLLGGYGWYSVKKDLFKYDFNKREWLKIKLVKNEMTPRAWFTMGKGFKDGEFLIYGGMGNETGDQNYGIFPAYDLYLLNLNDLTITKQKLPKEQKFKYVYLFSELYLDRKDSSFYFLSQDEEKKSFPITLNKLDLKTGDVSVIANKFWSTDRQSWIYSHLYYDKTLNELVSVIFDSAKVEFYSISYPPILTSQKTYEKEKLTDTNYALILLMASVGVISVIVVLIYFKKKKNKPINNIKLNSNTNDEYEIIKPHSKNALHLLGECHLYDRDGNDICTSISPKLKEIFLLVFIRSMNNHHSGITSEELSSIIWPDSSPESVKSSRGVAINKLRKALSSTDGIGIDYSGKHWLIKFNNGASCDYLEYLKLKSQKPNDDPSIDNSFHIILNIFSGGEFLKGISYEWLDPIKYALNNEIIVFLKSYLNNTEVSWDFNKIIQLCDLVLLFDSVDQDANNLKIKTLYAAGRHHIARNSYNLFVAEYRRLYDENYPLSFEKIIHS